MTEKRIIKKYANRRLYDTVLGSYITLDNVKELVYDNIDFKVIDARTEKDLTQSTLLQIITEQESGNKPIFTTAILQDFIRFYQAKSQSMLTHYLEEMMKSFLQQKNVFQTQWEAYQKLMPGSTLLQETLWPKKASGNSKIKNVKTSQKSARKNK